VATNDFILLTQIAKDIAALHERSIQLEEECRKLRNEVTEWKRTAYFLGGRLSVFQPNEHLESIVLVAREAAQQK
jgi:hypothetical protein